MSYEENIPNITPGFSGAQEFPINNLGPINFSQIFNGVPQFYPGSSFTVEEVLEIGTLIRFPELVDVDFRWYPPKLYLGTWTIFDQLSVFGTYPEDRGFLEDTINKIRRYSTYVIQGNAAVPIGLNEEFSIDNCNFLLNQVGVEVPPFAGSQLTLEVNDSVFKGRTTLRKVPLLDQEFNARIKTIGLHIHAGAELTFINYKARIINAISVDLQPFPFAVCQAVPAEDCTTLFNTFLIANAAFATLAEAENDHQTNCPLIVPPPGWLAGQQWTCPTDPLDIRSYWVTLCVAN